MVKFKRALAIVAIVLAESDTGGLVLSQNTGRCGFMEVKQAKES